MIDLNRPADQHRGAWPPGHSGDLAADRVGVDSGWLVTADRPTERTVLLRSRMLPDLPGRHLAARLPRSGEAGTSQTASRSSPKARISARSCYQRQVAWRRASSLLDVRSTVT